MIGPRDGSDSLDVANLVSALKRDIKPCDLQLPKEYSYASLPLCVIDSVFSMGVKYKNAQKAVDKFCALQVWAIFKDVNEESGTVSNGETVSDFVELLSPHSPESRADNIFGNRQRTSTRSGILKAEAVLQFATVLRDHGIQKLGDTEDLSLNDKIEKRIREIPGQSSGICFKYFLMLAGSEQFVKADRMICRYVTRALGRPAPTNPAVAQRLLVAAASELLHEPQYGDVTPRTLDYAVWSFQRFSKNTMGAD